MSISKNILIIVSQYAPLQTPNVYRWQAIAEYWNKNGHQVYVLTSLRKGSPISEKISGVQVYREGHNTLFDWFQNKVGFRSRRNEVVSSEEIRKPSVFRHVIERVLDLTYRKRYWPDGSFMWIKPAISRLEKEFQKSSLDVIISVGLPFSAHLIAKDFKIKNKSVHWLMDIEDPFCYSKEFWVNNFKRYESKNIEEERNAFQLADSISLTNGRAIEKYLELFPFAKSKMTVIPPMHTLPDSYIDQKLENAERKNMVFVGSFYENVRSPQYFLKLIQELKERNVELYRQWDFQFYGQQNPWSSSIFEEYNSLENIKLFGLKSRAEVFGVLKNADLIVNISNRTDYHLPSKLVDYIWSGKPIINFYSTIKDQSKSFLIDYPLVNHLQEDIEVTDKNYQSFIKFVRYTQGQYLDEEQVNELLSDYRLEVISKQYMAQFDGTTRS